MNEFKDKVVLVAGGSRGIGRGIATAFACQGAKTVLVASSAEHLAAAVEQVAKAKGAVAPETCIADLRTMTGCESVQRFVANRFGQCDILINSAGATRAGAFIEQGEDAWQDGFALKFFGCVRLCRLLWPMLQGSHGHVVNIIGGAARTPDPDFLIGGSVNAAMHNFTKGLAGLGRRDGINVNAILPGLTATDRVELLFEQRAKANGLTIDEVRQQQIKKDGIARLGMPEDIAALALFLCSSAARHIQGTAIAVDGGATPGVY